jgi:hypothetical protein
MPPTWLDLKANGIGASGGMWATCRSFQLAPLSNACRIDAVHIAESFCEAAGIICSPVRPPMPTP